MIWFPKLEDPVWTDELEWLVSKYRMFDFQNRMFRFLLASFQRLVFGGQV
jgi:hypothetical protein